MTRPAVSIVMSTWNRPALLHQTLASIARQRPPFTFELIVVDDGPQKGETQRVVEHVCRAARFETSYTMTTNQHYRNPCVARNIGLKQARGQVVIMQSDDVMHGDLDTIERLVRFDHASEFTIATVWNRTTEQHAAGVNGDLMTGTRKHRPFFFLGAVSRRAIYSIGGNCEDFTRCCFDDDWLADCLVHGAGLRPVYLDGVRGYHQHHARPASVGDDYRAREQGYRAKRFAAETGQAPWIGGPAWPYHHD